MKTATVSRVQIAICVPIKAINPPHFLNGLPLLEVISQQGPVTQYLKDCRVRLGELALAWLGNANSQGVLAGGVKITSALSGAR